MANSPAKPYARGEALALLFCVGAAAALMAGHWSYTLDDTYIYMQFARNILAGNGMSFNAGEPVYGFTSPLWLWMIATFGRCGIELLLAAKILGAASTLAAILVFHVAVRRVIADRWIAIAATFIWATNAWLVRWGVCGMEAPLAAAMSIAALDAYVRERERGSVRWSPILFGVGVLVRPEFALLGVIVFVDLLLNDRRSKSRDVVLFVVIAAAVVVPWCIVAWQTFHTIIPTTLAAKSEAHFSFADTIATLQKTGSILAATNIVELFCFAALVLPGVRRRITSLPLLFVLWPLVLVCMYAGTNAVVMSRYILVILPFIIIVGWSVLSQNLLDNARIRMMIIAVMAFVVLQNELVVWMVVKPHTRSFTQTVENVLIPIGKWLNANSSPDAIVATPDIGAIGYFSERPVLDLGGLITPRIRAEFPGMSYDDIVRNRLYLNIGHPDFIVDRDSVAGRLVSSTSSPRIDSVAVWRAPSLGIVTYGNGVVYTVYTLH